MSRKKAPEPLFLSHGIVRPLENGLARSMAFTHAMAERRVGSSVVLQPAILYASPTEITDYAKVNGRPTDRRNPRSKAAFVLRSLVAELDHGTATIQTKPDRPVTDYHDQASYYAALEFSEDGLLEEFNTVRRCLGDRGPCGTGYMRVGALVLVGAQAPMAWPQTANATPESVGLGRLQIAPSTTIDVRRA